MGEKPLAEKFIGYTDLCTRAGIVATWDDFYEWARVPEEKRNNDTAIQLKKDLTEIRNKEI